MLELWELRGRDDCRYSTFSWRTRLALHHKGLPFAAHPIAVSDKTAIGFSGQGKVPILKHDGRVITDSWTIALYLEKEFPERRTLFGGDVGADPHAGVQCLGGSRTHSGAHPLSDARRARLRRRGRRRPSSPPDRKRNEGVAGRAVCWPRKGRARLSAQTAAGSQGAGDE